ncbi:MAG: hypothetical protein ACRBC3_22340 [Burkholderiaceae bacterium]
MNKPAAGSTPIIADVTFVKTPKGHGELKTRRYGLSPRTRQLLLLIDGVRTSVQLLKIFPERELGAYLAILEINEFIRAASSVAHLDNSQPSQDQISALSAAASVDEFGRSRARILVRLLRLVGPAGEPFALRIISCADAAELRTLFPAILSVVEVFGGPIKAQQFARETMPT